MNRFKLLVVPTFFFLFSAVFVYATDSSFTVSQSVTSDSTPPTTPTILSVTPVTSSQIDVSWSTSTDDTLLSGYKVFRDAVQIATTTLQSYSDTGLSADTSYSYTVKAYDSVGNVSSSSAAAATSTLALPATSTPTTSASSGGGGFDVELISLNIETQEKSAVLTWETNNYTQYTLRWGRTSSYEQGFVTTDVYSRKHTTKLSDLEPGTTYVYELIAYDRDGKKHALSTGKFETNSSPDDTAPANVSRLQATVVGNDVRLSWVNPEDQDFSHVRIIRSHLFFPADPYDGFIVYRGEEEEKLDIGALNEDGFQYYTVFSYDNSGNVSSGAVVFVQKPGFNLVTDPKEDEVSDEDISTSTRNLLEEVTFEDFKIVQGDETLDFSDNKINIDGSKPVSITVPYEKLPEHLKTVTVTFTHPDNQDLSFSFLLRVNKDKSAYEAMIAPFYETGEFKMDVSIFDYKTKKMKEVSGTLAAEYKEIDRLKNEMKSASQDNVMFAAASLLLIIFLSFILFLLVVRRRHGTSE